MFKELQAAVKKLGVARVSADLGFRDTGRVKNWIIRKKIPADFEKVVENYLKGSKSCK